MKLFKFCPDGKNPLLLHACLGKSNKVSVATVNISSGNIDRLVEVCITNADLKEINVNDSGTKATVLMTGYLANEYKMKSYVFPIGVSKAAKDKKDKGVAKVPVVDFYGPKGLVAGSGYYTKWFSKHGNFYFVRQNEVNQLEYLIPK
mmetsp:Transcript_42029/g.48726  ORF Transcript_42029/g.48726 Transcript_42029/m.48726 type:complete len:147 (+) Transcript_42029:737-1177(+)